MDGAWKTFVISEERDGTRTVGPKRAVLGSVDPEQAPSHGWHGIGAQWDWRGGRLRVTSDPYGFHPLFYHSAQGRFAIGSSVRDLLRHGAPADLDDRAISVFPRLGFFLGDDTPFRSIRAVPPGARLAWQDGWLDLETGDRAGTETAGQTPGRDTAIRIYGELFQSVIDGMAPPKAEKTAVPLSGGRDSRHILLALERSGRVPDACVTVHSAPPQADEDAVVARVPWACPTSCSN